VARLAAAIAGVSYSFTAHARDIFHGNVVREQLARKLDDAATAVTVSRYNEAWLQREFDESSRSVEVVYNGLDLDGFPYSDPAEREAVLIGIGRLVEKKGFADLIEACAVLKRAGRRFRCEIIGGGPCRESLAARVAELGLGDRVQFLGPLPATEVAPRLAHAAVLAAPCVVASDGDRDGLPTVLLEAMALGTPCVSTDVTGIPEAIENSRTGLIVPRNAPSHLAEACGRLLEDSDLRVRIARNARRRIEKRFDIRRNAERLRALFSRAVGIAAPTETT
jgi:glycosyltransferase involved in cell wall biosynthesis